LHHSVHSARIDSLKVRIIPDFIVVHTALVARGHGPHVVPPVFDGPWFGSVAWHPRGGIRRSGRSPSRRATQRKQDFDVMLLSQCYKRVETLKMPITLLRLKPGPDYIRIPQAPRAEGYDGPR